MWVARLLKQQLRGRPGIRRGPSRKGKQLCLGGGGTRMEEDREIFPAEACKVAGN